MSRSRLRAAFIAAAIVGAVVGVVTTEVAAIANKNQAESQQPAVVQMTDQASHYLYYDIKGSIDPTVIKDVNFNNDTLRGTFNVFSKDGSNEYIVSANCAAKAPVDRHPGETENAINCNFGPPKAIG